MTRSFHERPIEPDVLERVLDAARRAPSAGNSQGWELLVLSEPADRARYWDLTLPEERRAAFPWPGLLRAPVLVLPLADEAAYKARYAEPDKEASGLGAGGGAEWPVPYWLTDTAFGVMLLLLAAEDDGLGALFFGLFQAQAEVLAAFGVPGGLTPVGVVALGHPDGQDHPSGSAQRGRRTVADITHHGHW
jgi:nitroreductase